MRWEENIPLSKFTSFHVGGPARYFAHVTSADEAREAVVFAQEKNLPFFVLGKGSNTLFPDNGYPGVIVYMANRTVRIDGTTVIADSGVFMRPLVNKALTAGLRGLEELAGIPGTVGGSVRGNAGTWSTEIKDVVTKVDILRPHDGQWREDTLTTGDCLFGYRDSIFKRHPDWIILRAYFALHPGDPAEGQKRVMEDLQQRHSKQPYNAPSAGSIFKNPDKENRIFSGALIEQAGLKGLQQGGAQISPKHGNFIVNTGKATSADIRTLIERIQTTVYAQHKITLEPEIVIVNPD